MSNGPPLRFVSFLSPALYTFYEGAARFIGKRLGMPVEISQGQGPVELDANSGVDVAFMCGFHYVRLSQQVPSPVELLAASVLQGERYNGKPIYFSDVIVRHDAPWNSFSELRGRSWAYNELDSHSGYNLTRYHLIRMREVSGFFGKVVCAGAHHRAVEMVCSGAVDAAAIDCLVLAALLRDDPTLQSRLRIIDTLGPSTSQPVVIASGAPPGLKTEVRSALLSMADDPDGRKCLAGGLLERYVPIVDTSYDDIRAMIAAAHAANYWTIR